jgi:hypothetical protein
MKKHVLLFALLILCYATGSHAQTFINKKWVQTFGTPDALNLVSSAIFPDGSVVIVGNTSSSLGDKDVLVTKYTVEGNQEWQQTFGGDAGGNDFGIAVRVDADQAVIVAGAVINSGTGQDIAVAKYDVSGD